MKHFEITTILGHKEFTHKCEKAYDAVDAILEVLFIKGLSRDPDELMEILLKMKHKELSSELKTSLFDVEYVDDEMGKENNDVL